MNKALSESKSSIKSTHASFVRHFVIGMAIDSDLEFEAMLAYWLLWYVFPSDPEGDLNSYMFPLIIRWAKGERLALMPIYLGSLLYILDKCIRNIVKSVGCYYVVTHADTAFLQLFLWERSKTRSTKLTEYDAVEMVRE